MRVTMPGRNKKQSRDGREKQAADNGAAEGRVLFAAFAQTKSHRDHADDHGEGGHQNGTQTGEPGFERGFHCRVAMRHAFAGVTDDQNTVRRRDAHAHDGAGECGNAERRMGQEQHPDDAGQGAGQGGDDNERIRP